MTPGGTTTLDTRIEQFWAVGLVPEQIARRLGIPDHIAQRPGALDHIIGVGEAMDAAAHHQDDPHHPGRCRNDLHEQTPEDTYTSPKGDRTCRPCKRDARRRCTDKQRATR